MSNSLHVLFVDDNPRDRTQAIRELRREFPHLQIQQVAELEEWALALERGNFDLVITEQQLNWSDGLTVLQAVKAHYPSCPVIMFTATDSAQSATQAFKAGLDDYVLKTSTPPTQLALAARAALQKAQALEKDDCPSLFDHLPVAIYRTTPEGQIIYANPTMAHTLGYPDPESLLSVNATDLYVNPNDRAKLLSLIESEGVVRHYEVQLWRYDGSIIWVDDKALAVRGPDGQVRYYEGSLEDITEQVQVEVALRHRNRELALINRTSQAFNSTLDLDQVLVTVLEEVRHLLDVVACSVWLTDPGTQELVCRHATGPRSKVAHGWRLAPGEGLAGWVAQSGESLIVPDIHEDRRHFKGVDQETGLALRSILSVPLKLKGKIIGVLQVVDIQIDRFHPTDLALIEPLAASAAIAIENARLYATEQQRTVALARALEQQQELDRLKDEFIQNVSHELRTPLSIARGYAEMLHAGALGQVVDNQQRPVATIVRQTRILNDLIEDITTILENETRQPVLESVSMARLVSNSLTDFQGLADQAGLTLHGQIAESVPRVKGHTAHLRQVIDNLISNALKFTPPGGEVNLNLHSTDENVILQVSDTGIGIAPEHHRRIFDRFYQIDGSSRRRYSGTGLGLALVKEVVEAHGGTIHVDSQLGQGTTFTVHLPFAPA